MESVNFCRLNVWRHTSTVNRANQKLRTLYLAVMSSVPDELEILQWIDMNSFYLYFVRYTVPGRRNWRLVKR
jgi:hypothetical protein